ncbi:hypothetical protein [Methanobacterium formicicum]|uniref:Uncharacterized protein n=1 Tax=Methanobacterium formicicum (strain DSM 3637 / PP1) TaxID=1204725 RepID=K2RSH5_METFP|nr:hypothetical protein [Methanobacterium formicicum]EKF85715.1 hypothetical protein A994_06535 [Methanobacterium formicicum DSM 3637]
MLKVPNINLGLIAVIFVLLVVSISVACAHQPRLVIGDNASNDNPIVIQNPEVSQAFYGELQGQSNYYQIKSDNQFKFYLNLLVPASPGIPPDFISAQVLDSSGNVILTLDGTNSTWNSYFEEFGGDYYLKGPETKADLPAGTYYIKIFNTANQGKYSIAIGEEESFPLDETMKALVTIPLLKEQIFGKPVPTLFFEFLGIIIAFGSTLVLFALLLMSRKSKEITQLTVTLNSMVKPVIWLGIAITTIVWLYVMYKNPFNIEGIVNTILLVVLIIFNWYIGSKLAKTEFGKLPLISMTVFIILWLIYTYLAIALI